MSIARAGLLVIAASCLVLSAAACEGAPRGASAGPQRGSGAASAGAEPTGGAGSAETGPADAPWGTAQPVRGFAALPGRDNSLNPQISQLSCAAPGDCTLGGLYFALASANGAYYDFVVDDVDGSWDDVQLVPGVTALEKGPGADIGSVSCTGPGDCTATGDYTPVPLKVVGPSLSQTFVTSEVGGIWQTARPMPGFVGLDTGAQGGIDALSCASPGNCVAVGAYTVKGPRGGEHNRAVVADQVNGTWRSAQQPPGAAFLNAGGSSQLMSVSCAAPGDCGAGGTYTGQHEITHAFVISEAHDTWATAQEVRGVRAPSWLDFVSCASPGDCSAVGGASNGRQLFVVSSVNGVWRPAQKVRHIGALNVGQDADFTALSCASPGNCSAAGTYALAFGRGGNAPPTAAFVVNEVHGVWGSAVEVPGTAHLNTGRNAAINGLSCTPDDVCTAGGFYTGKGGLTQSFVITAVQGAWRRLRLIRGIDALGGDASEIDAISCPAQGRCTASGHYLNRKDDIYLFVVAQK
jgi:hypothetical protein